jgi:hypothetical protein
MENIKTALLERPVDQLALSEASRLYLKSLNINRLQELIDFGWENLKKQGNFNYITFNEVVSLLRESDLLYLLEPSS